MAGYALTRELFEAWLREYGRAWIERDAGAAAALFTPDGSYQESPHREPMRGPEIAAYWRQVAEDQRHISFRHEVIAVEGDTGVNRWQAECDHLPSGGRWVMDGIFVVRFDASGRCRQFQEWWNLPE